jgi:hypothetical protein
MTRSERQFNAFVEAAQNQGENEEAAATLGALITRMLSQRAAQSARERSADAGSRARAPLPYAGKPKRSSGRQSP